MRVNAVRGLTLATIVIVLAVISGACSDTITVGTAPSIPAASTTDTFTGSVAQQGSMVHSFSITATAPMTITLTDVQPLTTMGLGVGLGTWDGINCAASFAKNENARLGTAALTGTTTAGNYCVRVYDSGNIPAGWTVTYKIQITHY